MSLISNNDGPFNYTFGYTLIDGEEPYVYSELFNGVETGSNNLNIPVFYQDNSALCEASLEERHPGALWRNATDPSTPENSTFGLFYGCHGSAPADQWSDVTNAGTHSEILRLRLRMTGLVFLLTTVALSACSKLESYFVDEPVAAGVELPDKDVTDYLQSTFQSARAMPESALMRGRLGMAYDVNGLRDAALATYQQAESLDPDDFRWPYFSAQLIAESGDYKQALAVLERALAIDADYASAWAWRGTWLLKVGLPDDAMVAFERAAELDAGPITTLYVDSSCLASKCSDCLDLRRVRMYGFLMETLSPNPQCIRTSDPLRVAGL